MGFITELISGAFSASLLEVLSYVYLKPGSRTKKIVKNSTLFAILEASGNLGLGSIEKYVLKTRPFQRIILGVIWAISGNVIFDTILIVFEAWNPG